MNNSIFDIQQFSVHDGPGIRTTVFLKGCNLRCAWCHNPESIPFQPVLQLYTNKCIHCKKCIEVCPKQCNSCENNELKFQRELCNACGECTKICYAECRQIAGKEMSVDEVMEIVKRDLPFYKRTGGGVTFSGGEPMLQHDFLLTLLQKSKELQIHTAVDTAGNVPFEWFEQVKPFVNLFLYDLKIMDNELHKKYTGGSNIQIIENLKKLALDGSNDVYIRIPIIPDVNDNEANMKLTAEVLYGLKGIKLVELLPFHPLGEGKYHSMGMEYPASKFGQLKKGKTTELAEVFKDFGISVKAH